jgi:hypothetical protein
LYREKRGRDERSRDETDLAQASGDLHVVGVEYRRDASNVDDEARRQ